MSVLGHPRPKIIEDAIRIGRRYCAGQRIDGAPAFGHGTRVAATVVKYWPDAPATWAATAFVHDLPEFITDADGRAHRARVAAAIRPQLGDEVLGLVWGLWSEHEVYDVCDRNPGIAEERVADLAEHNPPLLCMLSADQMVSFVRFERRVAKHVREGGTEEEFWRARGNLLARMPYFRRFRAAALPHVPNGMAEPWGRLLDQVPQHAVPSAGLGRPAGMTVHATGRRTRG